MAKAVGAGSAQTSRGRRHDVEERLRQIGVPAHAAPPSGRLVPEERHGARLRAALESLGPVFASFGLYLGSRLDLLPRRDCQELGRIRDVGFPAPPSDLVQLFRRELGAPPPQRFFSFQMAPINVRLLFQDHAAWLAPGAPIVVRVVRPDVAQGLERDLTMLSAVEPYVAVSPDRFQAALVDFSLALRRRLDQRGQADALQQLAEDWRTIGAFDAPFCYRDHSSVSVLTVARVEGVALGDAFSHSRVWTAPPFDREPVARQLCAAWLRQAIEGRIVPCAFGPRDVLLLPDRMVYVGSQFETQTSDGRVRFLGYINAAAADDPDGACEWVMAECEARRNGGAEEELRRRFRQAVPFRDGESSGEDNLAEHLLVHWRATAEAGWRLRPHLLQLYRAVHALSVRADALVPGKDVLTLALQDARLRIGLHEARQLVNPLGVPATLDTLLANMVTLPQKLDEVLTLAAEGRLRVKLHMPTSEEQRRVRNGTVALVAALSVLAGLAFLFRVVVPAPGAGAERIGALVLLIAGFWLLKAARDL